MIRKLASKVLFKATPPIEFEFVFKSVRLQGDIPDFKALMVINKYGKCATGGPVLVFEDAELQAWNIRKSIEGSPILNFQIAGRRFDVSEKDFTEVSNYFLSNFPHIWNREL
jgi:hypothetical protein